MAILYALLTSQQDLELRECFIEGIDLASMKLHTLISLGSGWPTAFAISGAQQRAYVADPSHSEVRVYDTAGPLVGKVGLSSPPYDCALTGDGHRLLVSTQAGLASIDTTALTVTTAVQGPFEPSSNSVWPAWAKGSAAIALSPDSNELAVEYGDISPDSPKTPPAAWVVNVSDLSTAKFFLQPAEVHLAWPVYDVAYAGSTGSILFLAAVGVVVAMDAKTGKVSSWTQLGWQASFPWLNSLAYSPAAGRAYVTSGLQTATGKIFEPSLWIVDPIAATAQHVEGFTGAPYLTCVEDASQQVYVAVRRRQAKQNPKDIAPPLPDQLARYNAISASLEPAVYEFTSSTLNVIAMQTIAESVFDPGVDAREHAHAEQSVEILVGLIGGGSGWVITPHGVIKPVDPAPIQPGVPLLPDTLSRVLRAGLVARTAANIPDRAAREQITHNALAYAQRLLAQAKIG